MEAELFLTYSLRSSPHGEKISRVLAAAINAVDPANSVAKYMQRSQSQLTIGSQVFDLDTIQRVFVIGFGKASIPMGQATAKILGDYLTQGILITKSHASKLKNNSSPFTIIEASHPVPNQRGVKGAKLIIELLQSTCPNDLVIFLISGGGSALLTAPVSGISLADLQNLNQLLLASGANINQINTLRKHLSQVKGGNLACLAYPAQVVSLILSDVIGDPLDVIASGATVPDPTSYGDALEIIERFELAQDVPPAILAYLQRGVSGQIPETPKHDDPAFERTYNRTIGNNFIAADAARTQAQKEGLNTLLLTTRLQGEAREMGPTLGAVAQQIAVSGDPLPRPACVIAGGETTVTLLGDGRGGRNQELALSAVSALAGLKDIFLVALATDGDDGPTDAAGAVVTGNTWGQANHQGLNTAEFLARNAAYEFFEPLGDLLKPGPTMTNVNDLVFIFAC